VNRLATLALVHSTAKYCAPVSCRSAHTHLIDPAIIDALQIVTGYLRPKPEDNLTILADIQSAELRCNRATLSLARYPLEPGHLLHSALTCPLGVSAHYSISNGDIHLCLLHSNSSAHPTTTYVQSTGQITNGMQSGWKPYKIPHFHPRYQHQPS